MKKIETKSVWTCPRVEQLTTGKQLKSGTVQKAGEEGNSYNFSVSSAKTENETIGGFALCNGFNGNYTTPVDLFYCS